MDKTHKVILIKWVRSGIGFNYRQKAIVESLGLRRLNQVVLRQDTPQNRGIVAAVSHLLEIVPEAPVQPWTSVPEYRVYPKATAPAASAAPLPVPEDADLPSESPVEQTAAEGAEPAESRPAKRAVAKTKSVKAAEGGEAEKPAARREAEAPEATKD